MGKKIIFIFCMCMLFFSCKTTGKPTESSNTIGQSGEAITPIEVRVAEPQVESEGSGIEIEATDRIEVTRKESTPFGNGTSEESIDELIRLIREARDEISASISGTSDS